METWDEAWRLSKDSAEPFGRAVADDAFSRWLDVAASFGQADAVRKRVEDLAGRNVRGAAATKVAEARETVALLTRYPDQVIASGPEAVRVLLEEEHNRDAAGAAGGGGGSGACGRVAPS